MKKQLSLFCIFGLIITISSCSKEDPAPTTPPIPTKPTTPTGFTGCRIVGSRVANVLFSYSYDKDGYVESAVHMTLRGGGTTKYQYDNGLLVGITDGLIKEVYEYSNAVLKKMKVVQTDEKIYDNYQIDIETDANKRIVKMSDSFGYVNEFKRDSKGNIVEIRNLKGKDEQYRLVIGEYDDKKSRLELFKGWQFNVNMYYADYMTPERLVNNMFGCANNATKIQRYVGNSLTSEWIHTVAYGTGSYPTLITDSSDRNNLYQTSFDYAGCN